MAWVLMIRVDVYYNTVVSSPVQGKEEGGREESLELDKFNPTLSQKFPFDKRI